MAKQRLGRGFDVLIPTGLDASILEEDKTRVQKILISDIHANPDQPRREFNEAALADLTASIKKHGVLQPIIVVKAGDGGYRIVAGERRWRAAKSAELTHIPTIVRSLEELEQVELALIENIQRVDLSPLEQALSVYRLQQQFNLSLEQISEKLGKAQSTVSNLSRLLKLPESAREALREGKITEGHARAILSINKNPSKQEELLRCILDNNWTVREAENFVSEVKKTTGSTINDSQNELEDRLSQKLGARVKVKRTKSDVQLIISVKNDEELTDLVTKANWLNEQ